MHNKYGDLPSIIGHVSTNFNEMCFYQYLPIKLPFGDITYEPRLHNLSPIIGDIIGDILSSYTYMFYKESYIYLTVKNMFCIPGISFNRPGYHSDGFMTKDINYIWSDKFPTVFNASNFNLSQDDRLSLLEMQEQGNPEKDVTYPNGSILKLSQYNIHKCGEITEAAMRCFVKISVSKDKYDLEGNSRNYLLDYLWDMKPRKQERNIPQSTFYIN